MKRAVLLTIALMISSIPAYAGHGTIEETDAAIIVEYTGDANDKPAQASNAAPAATSAPAADPSAPAPPEATQNGPNDQERPVNKGRQRKQKWRRSSSDD